MNKIPTLFQRNETDRRYVTEDVTPGCEWVIAGEGVATRKYDGTCLLLADNGTWWARREVKRGAMPPPNYWPLSTDEVTGKTVGWEPIEQSSYVEPFYEALEPIIEFGSALGAFPVPGTYELVGPKINGNHEHAERHRLEPHGNAERFEYDAPPEQRDWQGMVLHLGVADDWEGIVWHHPDGRMAKLKARDIRPGR